MKNLEFSLPNGDTLAVLGEKETFEINGREVDHERAVGFLFTFARAVGEHRQVLDDVVQDELLDKVTELAFMHESQEELPMETQGESK